MLCVFYGQTHQPCDHHLIRRHASVTRRVSITHVGYKRAFRRRRRTRSYHGKSVRTPRPSYLISQPSSRVQASETREALCIRKERYRAHHLEQEDIQRARNVHPFRISYRPCGELNALSALEIPSDLVQGDPTFKPKARLQNPRTKPITIQRGINLITLNPSSSTELWDGDAVHLVGGITVVFVTKEPRKAITTKHTSLVGSLGTHSVVESLQL